MSTFVGFGVLPILVAWGVYWVRAAEGTPRRTAQLSNSGATQQPMSEILAERLRGTALRPCRVCNCERQTRYVLLNENISYFVARRERTLSGFLCFSCMSKRFAEFEMNTLFFTWWGIVGVFVGPAYLLGNLIEFLKNSYHFAFDRTPVAR